MPIGKARLRISDYRDKRKRSLQVRDRKFQIVSLSLTSMVDMFAILVIFLLVNTDTVAHWIEVSAAIQLPKAQQVEDPSEGETVEVSPDGIRAGKQPLLVASNGDLSGLKKFLSNLPKTTMLNIVGHAGLPYSRLKTVLAACQSSGFENISLAVQPIR